MNKKLQDSLLNAAMSVREALHILNVYDVTDVPEEENQDGLSKKVKEAYAVVKRNPHLW